MSEANVIYWTAAKQQGNKFLQKLHPNMLTPQGHKVMRERTFNGHKTLKSIHYDIGYVVKKLVTDILLPLDMDAENFSAWLLSNRVLIEDAIDAEIMHIDLTQGD